MNVNKGILLSESPVKPFGMAKKTTQRTIRFDEETISQMDALCAAADIDAPKLIRALIGAAHRYYSEHGHIYLPLEIRPLTDRHQLPSTLPAKTDGDLPHTKTKHTPKKTPDKKAYRLLQSASRRKQIHATGELAKQIRNARPTAESPA